MVDFVHQNLFGFLIIWIVDELIPSAKNRIKLIGLVVGGMWDPSAVIWVSATAYYVSVRNIDSVVMHITVVIYFDLYSIGFQPS